MSKRVYQALKYGEPAPFELTVWDMAERFGWTLEYIASLPVARLHDWYNVMDGKAKASQTASQENKVFRRGR